MKRPSKPRHAEHSAVESSARVALAVIREQFRRLDSDEQQVLFRILRQTQLLDAALADLHLFLPVIEICFYGVRSGGNTGCSFSPRSLARLIKQWVVMDRNATSRVMQKD